MGWEEKRESPRVKIQMPLHYQIRGTPEYNNVITNDISRGGMSFTNSKFINPRAIVMLEINLLSRVLRPIGRIIRSSPLPRSNNYQVGIQFLEVEPNDRNYLTDYLNMQLGTL